MKRVLIILSLSLIICLLCSSIGNVSGATQETVECTPEASNEEYLQITEEILVGVWQNQYGVAAGLTGHYNFFPDGKFRYDYNEMDGVKKYLHTFGKWKLEENRLTLNYEKRTCVIGGEITYDSNFGTQIKNRITEVRDYIREEEYTLNKLKTVINPELSADYVVMFEKKISNFETPDEYVIQLNCQPHWKLNWLDGELGEYEDEG